MLGTPPSSITPAPVAEVLSDKKENENEIVSQIQTTPTPVEQKQEIPSTSPTVTTEPMTVPAFTIPTEQTSVQPSAIMGNTLSPAAMLHNKTKGVKTLLFVVLFAALGFTTYFILKTMYPLEFANMFG